MKPSKYMHRKFKRDFEEGIEFWTGEDGEPTSFVTFRTEEGVAQIKSWVEQYGKHFERSRVQARFAYRDGHDGEWSHCRKLWRTGTEQTPFLVYKYEYE